MVGPEEPISVSELAQTKQTRLKRRFSRKSTLLATNKQPLLALLVAQMQIWGYWCWALEADHGLKFKHNIYNASKKNYSKHSELRDQETGSYHAVFLRDLDLLLLDRLLLFGQFKRRKLTHKPNR